MTLPWWRKPAGRFVGRVSIDQLDGHGGDWFCTIDDLVFHDEDGSVYIAPAGTLSDGSSVPRVVWWIWPKVGKHFKAAIVHDHLCVARSGRSPDCHAVYRRALRACGCAKATQVCHWLAVRIFGPRWEMVNGDH